MAHFAELDESNKVLQVVVVSNKDILDENGIEREQIGISFLKNLFGIDTRWKQTSYNSSFRVRYAGKNFTYNEELDAFIPPKLYESWTLNIITADWDPPIEIPELTSDQISEGYTYIWDENAYQSDNTTGWFLVKQF